MKTWWIRPKASYCGEFIFDKDPRPDGPFFREDDLIEVVDYESFQYAIHVLKRISNMRGDEAESRSWSDAEECLKESKIPSRN